MREDSKGKVLRRTEIKDRVGKYEGGVCQSYSLHPFHKDVKNIGEFKQRQ